jgi:hypothetical protein
MFSADDLAVYPVSDRSMARRSSQIRPTKPCNTATRSPVQANALRLVLSCDEYRASTWARRNRSKHRCSNFVPRGQHRGLEPRRARPAVASAVAFIDFVTETHHRRPADLAERAA